MSNTTTLARRAALKEQWPESLSLWRQVKPGEGEREAQIIGVALALRRMRKFDEADATLMKGMSDLHGSVDLQIEYAWTALDRGHWEVALQRLDEIPPREPEHAGVILARASALLALKSFEEAERVLEAGKRVYPALSQWTSSLAKSAERQNNWHLAQERWESFRQEFPTNPRGYHGAMAAAEKLKDLSASDAIYRAANDQFDLSRDPWRHFCLEYARLPTSVGDKTQAVHRWKAVADVRPDEPILIGLAYSLINAHQFEEAEMVARRAFALYPSGAGVHAVYARTAFRLRQWNESEKRWIKMVERFPNNATGWAGLIDILRNLRKLEKAEAEAQKAIAKFPLDFEIGCEFASCAADRLGWEEALLRWRQMLINHPPRARVHIGAAVALRELGRLDESAQLLLDAKKIFPNEAAIHVEYAQISINQGQWAEALSRIAIGLSQFPDDVQLKGRRGDALQLAALAEDRQSSQAVDSIGHRASDDPIEMTHLISQFESLGDNCEFGLVQRHYGAEPLGLLRWTAITPIKLSEGLEARFDGLWEPDNVVLSMMRGEYFLQDKKYGMHMHTFIRSDVDQTKLHAQMLRRLKFLVGKLFDDIETAEKIFVYKMRDGIISDEEINLLEKTISKFGAVKLLCVRLISTEKPNGLVERISDHLAIGYIDKLSPAASHGEIHFGSWENICINAHKIFHP